MNYSVLTNPAVPVTWMDGRAGEVGIREAMLRAHEIRDVQGDTPLERFAVLRLLITMAMDMLHPETSYDRRDILDAGRFDPNVFDAYVSECEKDGPRFDLFDPDHPFLQSRYDQKLDEKAKKPVATIIHSLPSGNNHLFIDHRLESEHHVTAAKAFRALCASYLFSTYGLWGPFSVNNKPPLYISIIGDKLFETIVMNMLSVAEVQPLTYAVSQVPWRIDREVIPWQKVPDVSFLEGLTWMPRRITLLPDSDWHVSSVCFQPGLDFRGNESWADPFVPKRSNNDGALYNVTPVLDRAIWRDVSTLLYDQDGGAVRQPQIIRCLTNLLDEDELPLWIRLRATGLCTIKASYLGWIEDELSLPSELMYSQAQAELFRNHVQMVERIQSGVYSNVQKYVDKLRSGADNKEHEIATQCQQDFLLGAHDLLFGQALSEIIAHVPAKECVDHFCDAVATLLQDVIRRVLRPSGKSVKAVMSQIEAEKWIWIGFNKIKEERKKSYAGE